MADYGKMKRYLAWILWIYRSSDRVRDYDEGLGETKERRQRSGLSLKNVLQVITAAAPGRR